MDQPRYLPGQRRGSPCDPNSVLVFGSLFLVCQRKGDAMKGQQTIEPGSDPDIEKTRQHIREILRLFWQVEESNEPGQHDTDEWLPSVDDVTNESTDSA